MAEKSYLLLIFSKIEMCKALIDLGFKLTFGNLMALHVGYHRDCSAGWNELH